MVPTLSYEISRVSHYSGYCLLNFSYITGLSPSLVCLPRQFFFVRLMDYTVLTPALQATLVWALPLSLATTQGIDFSFFSCRYLDVSVPDVPLYMLLYLHIDTCSLLRKCVPTFGYLWFSGYLLLPIAFRSLSRPSSALGA